MSARLRRLGWWLVTPLLWLAEIIDPMRDDPNDEWGGSPEERL